jgi:hypothetical protein
METGCLITFSDQLRIASHRYASQKLTHWPLSPSPRFFRLHSIAQQTIIGHVGANNYASNTPVRFYWFSDRIEIHSPGGLYGEVTENNYLTHSSYRNPIIAEAMKTLGYVNRFGYGIQRAQKLLSTNGNPPAEFTFNTQSV